MSDTHNDSDGEEEVPILNEKEQGKLANVLNKSGATLGISAVTSSNLANSYADHLAALKDNGVVSTNNGEIAVKAVGATTTVVAESLAITNSLLQGYKNYLFIKEAGQNFINILDNVTLEDVLNCRPKIKKDETKAVNKITLEEVLKHKFTAKKIKRDISPDEIKDYCKQQLIKQITVNTWKAGANGTISFALPLFSLGMVYPVIFPVTASLSIAILGAGAIATTIATFVNKRKLNKKIDDLLNDDKQLNNKITSKARNFSQEYSRNPLLDKSEIITEKLKDKNAANKLDNVSTLVQVGHMLVKVGSMAKLVMPIIGEIGNGIGAIFTVVQSSIDALSNFRAREIKFNNLPDLINKVLNPNVDKKSFLILGKSRLEDYVEKFKEKICEQYNLDHDKSSKDLLKSLKKDDLNQIRIDCKDYVLNKKLSEFYLANKKNYASSKTDQENFKENKSSILNDYIVQEIGRKAAKDVRTAGIVTSLKIAGVAAGFSMFFPPPLTLVITGAALVGALIGTAITEVIARKEKNRFQQEATRLIDAKADKGETIPKIKGIALEKISPDKLKDQIDMIKVSKLIEAAHIEKISLTEPLKPSLKKSQQDVVPKLRG